VPFSRRQVFDAAHSSLNTINLAVVDDNEPFVRTVLWRTVANTLSMGFVVRKWSQMLGREVVERKQCVAIFRQALDRLVVLGSVFLGEDVDRYFGRSSACRPKLALIRANPSNPA
jgi:hypothetical protein